MHHMKIQQPSSGHEHVTWDPTDPAQVAEAQAKFDEAITQGHRAFRVESKLEAGEPIDQFDPALTEILLIAAVQGG